MAGVGVYLGGGMVRTAQVRGNLCNCSVEWATSWDSDFDVLPPVVVPLGAHVSIEAVALSDESYRPPVAAGTLTLTPTLVCGGSRTELDPITIEIAADGLYSPSGSVWHARVNGTLCDCVVTWESEWASDVDLLSLPPLVVSMGRYVMVVAANIGGAPMPVTSGIMTLTATVTCGESITTLDPIELELLVTSACDQPSTWNPSYYTPPVWSKEQCCWLLTGPSQGYGEMYAAGDWRLGYRPLRMRTEVFVPIGASAQATTNPSYDHYASISFLTSAHRRYIDPPFVVLLDDCIEGEWNVVELAFDYSVFDGDPDLFAFSAPYIDGQEGAYQRVTGFKYRTPTFHDDPE
ncbi:hypothetical protein [Thiorhodococcus fuscus]|uniref:Uncharacterized protein n=1 Tax=Thiorhodococcus fuscus TaxID=527200 RepID=A0ABW4YBR2_9GAMM